MNYKKNISIAFLHILLGIVFNYNPLILYIYIYLIGFYFLYRIIHTRNHYGEAHVYSAYIVGIEVLIRMMKVPIFWEIGKILVIVFLTSALVLEKKSKKTPLLMMVILFLLIPGIFIVDYVDFRHLRVAMSFNLFGLISLVVSSLYFYKRQFNKYNFSKIILFVLYPLITTLVVIFIRMGNISEIIFQLESNFITSGGFGPSQVSTLIGFGIVLLALTVILKIKIFFKSSLNLILIGIFFLFGLLTFARGGMLSPMISIVICWFTYIYYSKYFISSFFPLILFVFVLLFSWFSVSKMTGGILAQRYIETIGTGEKITMDFTGRIDIINSEIEIFRDNFWFGVGIGQSKYLHASYSLGRSLSSHTEFTRLLAEHGLFGIFIIFILVIFQVAIFLENNNSSKLILIMLVSFSLLTMFHAAMRLAVPGFCYGLAIINYRSKNQ